MSRCRCVGAAMVMQSTLSASKALDVGDGGTAQRAGDEFGLLAVGIGDADKLGAGNAGEHARMIGAHDADADDANAQRALRAWICRLRHALKASPRGTSRVPNSPSMAGGGWRPCVTIGRTRFNSKRYRHAMTTKSG